MAHTGTHHVVVALETAFCPVPDLELPVPHTYDIRKYLRTKPEEVAERIRDANIIISTVCPITAEVLSADISPKLKMISIIASGSDAVDLEACRARGIVVSNTPHCNVTSVSEHAIALYFALRRSIPLVHNLTRSGEWPRKAIFKTLDGPDGRPPRTTHSEIVGIIGYGGVGKKFELLAKSLGMKVLLSGRKGDDTPPKGRAPFETIIRECSVIFLCLPRVPETLNLISHAELEAMHPHALLINVSRGGIVDEKTLVSALKKRRIAGAATDVFLEEPATPENSPLLAPDTAELNLVTTPHVAWCAEDTNGNYQNATKENIALWLSTGEPKYRVV